MFRVLLSGPAGSGKHTIAKMLLKEFDNFGYFSAGDFIRDHIQRGTGAFVIVVCWEKRKSGVVFHLP